MIDENTLPVVPSFQRGDCKSIRPFSLLPLPFKPLLSPYALPLPFMPYKPSGLIPIKPAIYFAGNLIFAFRISTY